MRRKRRIKSITTKKVDALDLDFIPLEDKLEYVIKGESIPIAEFNIDFGKIILESKNGKEFEIDEEELN